MSTMLKSYHLFFGDNQWCDSTYIAYSMILRYCNAAVNRYVTMHI